MLKNGILEDIGAVIGASAALRLAGWQDGAPVYIPSTPAPEHRLCAILAPDDPQAGFNLLARLSADFGGETLCLPKVAELDYMRLRGQICRRLRRGVSVRCIAHDLGISERQINNHRRKLEEAGLLPLILTDQPPARAGQMTLELAPASRRRPLEIPPQAPAA